MFCTLLLPLHRLMLGFVLKDGQDGYVRRVLPSVVWRTCTDDSVVDKEGPRCSRRRGIQRSGRRDVSVSLYEVDELNVNADAGGPPA